MTRGLREWHPSPVQQCPRCGVVSIRVREATVGNITIVRYQCGHLEHLWIVSVGEGVIGDDRKPVE